MTAAIGIESVSSGMVSITANTKRFSAAMTKASCTRAGNLCVLALAGPKANRCASTYVVSPRTM